MNEIFAETNQELSQSAEANYVLLTPESHESSSGESDDINNNTCSNDDKKSSLGNKQRTKLVVAPQNRKVTRSQSQGLSQLAE